MKRTALTLPELLAHLANDVREAGGQIHWANAAGVAQSNLSDTLAGKRDPTPQILAALGYRKVVYYEPVEE